MNALWWAVVHGRKEVVDFFLSLKVIKRSKGAKILSKPWKLPDNGSSRYEKSIMTAFNTLSMEDAYQVVIAPSGTPLPWCFEQLPMLPKFLKKCGKEIDELQFPLGEDKGHLQPLINIAVTFSMLGPFELRQRPLSGFFSRFSDSIPNPAALRDLEVLKTLLEFKADPNAQDTQYRTAIDIIVAGIAKSLSFWSSDRASLTNFKHNLTVLQMLLDNGGNLNEINRAKLQDGLRTTADHVMVEQRISRKESNLKGELYELPRAGRFSQLWLSLKTTRRHDISLLPSKIQKSEGETKVNMEIFKLRKELEGLLQIVESTESK